ncbi:MAG: hypothetical protein CVV49_14760 [Spirochaetae bacterium HGW-Spirochaetae-5]|nr:MAG: hypothetical protein CVV49_14760 [Spirochaetae bacterium HGW-Spirochaetae-5]
MNNPGPPLQELIDHLILIPGEFTGRSEKTADVNVKINTPAIINDLLLDLGGAPLCDEEITKNFHSKKENKAETDNYLKLISILCYIYEHRFFIEKKSGSEKIKSFLLSQRLIDLSRAVKSSDEFITDPERREEICRAALDAAGYFPEGENEKNARDRLSTLDSVERKIILTRTAEAQKKANELKEAMMRKEAEEAASKMSRE